MHVIKHVYNQYDIFSGMGYDVHTRVQLERKEGSITLRYCTGQRLPNAVLNKAAQQLNPKLHYQNLEV